MPYRRLAGSSMLAIRNKLRRKQINFIIIIPLCTLGCILIYLKPRHDKSQTVRLKYCVLPPTKNTESQFGSLRHVHSVLQRIGYEMTSRDESWDLAWGFTDPFSAGHIDRLKIKPHQRINYFPGSKYITQKYALATTDSKFIPKAFSLPSHLKKFQEYAAMNEEAQFVVKKNTHRGVKLKSVSEVLKLTKKEASFVQEYVQKPFLVDGYKFDIGVYVVLTSVEPLRAYWYDGDVLFRYCEQKYYPLNASNLSQYVIRIPYRPTWMVPALQHSYKALGFGMRDAFNLYARSKGKNTTKMWQDVFDAIREIIVKKEKFMIKELKKYPPGNHFFQLTRFDLLVNEDLQVFLMEANAGPNLSSEYPQNQLLYDQILHSLFSLTGVSHVSRRAGNLREITAARNMVSAQKNIAVWGEECSPCLSSCQLTSVCEICMPCISNTTRSALLHAHAEHLHRADFKRLYPPPTKQDAQIEGLKRSTEANRLQLLWFQGKCNMDATWCS